MSVAKKMYTPYPIEVNIWGVNRVMMKLMDVSEVSRYTKAAGHTPRTNSTRPGKPA
jgi:hypothetical protein